MYAQFEEKIKGIEGRLFERITVSPEDGLALFLLRSTLGKYLRFWSRHIYIPVLKWLFQPAMSLCKCFCEKPTLDAVYVMAIDFYKLGMTVFTLLAYTSLWMCQGYAWSEAVAYCVIAANTLRLLELLAIVSILFFSRPVGPTHSSFRPVMNALWSYVEVSLSFAIVYLCLEMLHENSLRCSSGEHLSDTFIGPIYYSFITIATIGYGDFVPHSWIARLLACFESFVGVFLLVAVIQKAMSRTPIVRHQTVAEVSGPNDPVTSKEPENPSSAV